MRVDVMSRPNDDTSSSGMNSSVTEKLRAVYVESRQSLYTYDEGVNQDVSGRRSGSAKKHSIPHRLRRSVKLEKAHHFQPEHARWLSGRPHF